MTPLTKTTIFKQQTNKKSVLVIFSNFTEISFNHKKQSNDVQNFKYR